MGTPPACLTTPPAYLTTPPVPLTTPPAPLTTPPASLTTPPAPLVGLGVIGLGLGLRVLGVQVLVTLFLDLGSHYKIHCSEVGAVRCVLIFLVAAQIKELDDQTCSKVP
jgi:hypothetical protein